MQILIESLKEIAPLLAIIPTLIIGLIYNLFLQRRSKEEESERKNAKDAVVEAFNSANPADANILSMMTLNMSEIREFYIMTKFQAKRAFAWAITTFLVGFALFATSCVMAIISNSSSVSVIIPAVSGAIVELLSAGSLFIYKKTLEQLNVYYQYLHENERFLSAVQVSDNISQEKRDEVLAQIINKQMKYGPIETTASDN